MSSLNRLLNEIRQGFGHPIGEVGIAPIPPDLRAANAQVSGGRTRGAKHHFEKEIMPPAGQFPLEARRRHRIGT
jgi:hypothetical protein